MLLAVLLRLRRPFSKNRQRVYVCTYIVRTENPVISYTKQPDVVAKQTRKRARKPSILDAPGHCISSISHGWQGRDNFPIQEAPLAHPL